MATTTTSIPRLSTLNPSKSRNNANKRHGSTPLSSSEISYILQGCRDNVRLDGRTRTEQRSYTLLQKNALVLSNGSSRILGGSTHVLCSCKAELVTPSPLHPEQGVVELHVDYAGTSNYQTREKEETLQSTLSKLLLKSMVNLEKLCVVPHAYVWRLGVDVLVLSASGGSIMDTCSRAIRAALLNTQLPLVTPTHDKPQQRSTSSSGAQVDLAVDGDLQNAVRVPGAEEQCPIVVTVNVVKCPPKNTTVLVVDATCKEEACAVCQVRVAVDPCGNVCALHNQGPLEASLLSDILSTAVQASKHMFQQDLMVVQDTTSIQGQQHAATTTLLQDQFQFR